MKTFEKEEFLKKYNILNRQEDMMDVAKQIFRESEMWKGFYGYNVLINHNSHNTG